jgi:CheY-like chemotaxis protein
MEKAILYAEDDPELRKSMEKTLNLYIQRVLGIEAEVLVAKDGTEALKIIEESHDKLVAVVTDFNMPGANGFQVYEAASAHDIPTMILSGRLREDLPTGDYTYLGKGSPVSEIGDWLKACFDKVRGVKAES